MWNFFSKTWSEKPINRKKKESSPENKVEEKIVVSVKKETINVNVRNNENPSKTVKNNNNSIGYDLNELNSILTLEDLENFIKNNVNISFKKDATNTVFYGGNKESDVMFIGEAPGVDEDKLGQPFVGDSGKLLISILNDIGIQRDDIYITNVVNWRPPQNRTPTIEEIEFFKPILYKHIELKKPKFLCLLGATALKSVFGEGNLISKTRGKMLKYKDIPTMVTFHPSYILRMPTQKTLVENDLKTFFTAINTQ